MNLVVTKERVQVLEASFNSMSRILDELVGACINEDGKQMIPDRKILMREQNQ